MSKIEQINLDRSKIPSDLVASGSVVEMRYVDGRSALSLRAAKLLHLLVKAAGDRLTADVCHKIPLAVINESFHVSIPELELIAKDLISTVIKVTIGNRSKQTGILISAENNKDEMVGDLQYKFSDNMRLLFSIDDRWSILPKEIVMAFESRFALRLFEILSLRRNLNRKYETFELEDLRSRLGVEKGKLVLFGNFKQKCLEPAVTEVSKAMGMVVSYRPIKTGRAVTAIELTWTDPIAAIAPPKPDKPAPQTASKATRTAKTKPQATTIANDQTSPSLAFPAKGEARAIEPWGSMMRDLAPSYKIAGALEMGFRTAMLQEGVPLDAPDIQERFGTFVAERYEKFCESRPNAVKPVKRAA